MRSAIPVIFFALAASLLVGARGDTAPIPEPVDIHPADLSIVPERELMIDATTVLMGVTPRGEQPSDGFVRVVHPHFEGRSEDLPLLLAYHVVAINYLDVATRAEAELFGATLLGMRVDEYHGRVCELADELPAPVAPDFN